MPGEQKQQLVICYHGTDSEEKAQSILREGFRENSFFAAHMEDAMAFGGPWVFEVAFPAKDAPSHWEFVSRSSISRDRIVNLTHYEQTVMLDRPGLRQRIADSNCVEV